MGVKDVWTPVISAPALRVLSEGSTSVYCDMEVPAIQNRSHTGLCPMETAVREIADLEEALRAIKTALANL